MSVEDYKLLDADINEVGGNRFVSSTDIRRLRQQLSTKTGIRRYREAVWEMMKGPFAWWKEYVRKHPEGE